MAFDSTIDAMVEILVGVMLLPIMAGFIAVVSVDDNLSGYIGLTLILTLIVYVFAFGILLKGVRTLRGKK
jgi:uncharacterized Tic20 family protein